MVTICLHIQIPGLLQLKHMPKDSEEEVVDAFKCFSKLDAERWYHGILGICSRDLEKGADDLEANNASASCEEDVSEEDFLTSLNLDPSFLKEHNCTNLVAWLSEYKQVLTSNIKFDASRTQLLRDFESVIMEVQAIQAAFQNTQTTLSGNFGSLDDFQMLKTLPNEGFVYCEIRPVGEEIHSLLLPRSGADGGIRPEKHAASAVSVAHRGYPVYVRLVDAAKKMSRLNSASSNVNAGGLELIEEGGSVLFFERGPRTSASLRADFSGKSSVVFLDCSFVRDFQLDITDVTVLDESFAPSTKTVVVRLRFAVASDYWLWSMALSRICDGRVSLAGTSSASATSVLFGALRALSGQGHRHKLNMEDLLKRGELTADSSTEPTAHTILGNNHKEGLKTGSMLGTPVRRGGEWNRFSLHLGVALLSVIADQHLIQETRRQYNISGALLHGSHFVELNSRVIVSDSALTDLVPGSVVISLNNVSASSVGPSNFFKLLDEVPSESKHLLAAWKFPRSEYGVEARVSDINERNENNSADLIAPTGVDNAGVWVECSLLITSNTIIVKSKRFAVNAEDRTVVMLKMQLSKVKLRLVSSATSSLKTRGIGALGLCLELKETRLEGGLGPRITIAVRDFNRGFEMMEHLLLALRLMVGPAVELSTMLERSDHWAETLEHDHLANNENNQDFGNRDEENRMV